MNNSSSSFEKKPGHFVRKVEEELGEEVASVPEIFKSGRRELIQATLFYLGYTVLFYLPLVYIPVYVQTVAGLDEDKALQITALTMSVVIFLIPMMAVLSDKLIRRRSALITAFIAALMSSIPMFILDKDSYFYLLSVLVFFGIIVAVPFDVASATLVGWFPNRRGMEIKV
jgi:MHS family proline/betaine transporter-like MFS transporter